MDFKAGVCLLLISVAISQIQLCVAKSCSYEPSPVNLVAFRKTISGFGSAYRYERSTTVSDQTWVPVSGKGFKEGEFSYIRAYAKPFEEQKNWGKYVCGGFETALHVCSITHSGVSIDFLSLDRCSQITGAKDKFTLYVADEDVDGTSEFQGRLCKTYHGNIVGVAGGSRLGCGSIKASGGEVEGSQFTFYAIPGKLFCPVPDVPANSELHQIHSENGVRITSMKVECFIGHRMANGKDEQIVQCGDSGDWNEKFEACKPVDCGAPPSVAHGSYTGEGTLYNNYRMLTCDPGYETPNGLVSIGCLASGEWDDARATCEPRVCGHPGDVSNGLRVGDDFTFGGEVTYSCNQGYKLDGQDSLVCTQGGHWSASRPACKRIECGWLGSPANGRLMDTDFGVGETIRFTCYEGYELQGSGSLRCEQVEDHGEWDGSMPSCQKIVCPAPEMGAHGRVIGQDFSYGMIVHFECSPGFVRQGASVARCLDSGRWDQDPPKCSPMVCRDPGVPENGEREGDIFLYESTVTFTCHEGHSIVGNSAIICQENGRWSANTPTCQKINCSPLPDVPNGVRVSGSSTSSEFGQEVTFECFPGYELHGPEQTECQADGSWTNAVPSCDSCDKGSYKEGVNTARCQACPEFSTTLTRAASSITMCLCQDGYRQLMDGSCQAIACGELATPEHGLVQEGCSQDYGGRCTFDCLPGYVPSGTRTLYCDQKGWSAPVPTCNACPENTYKEKLGSLSCVPCGRHTTTHGVPGTSRKSCECINGYQGPPGGPCEDFDECAVDNGGCDQLCTNTAGSYYCQCTIPGYEIAEDRHRCTRAKACSSLEAPPEHGRLDCSYHEMQNSYMCSIKCEAGYFFVSGINDYVTCGYETGFKWSHRLVNDTARIPGCTEEFFVDTRLDMTHAYSLNGSCGDFRPDEAGLGEILKAAVTAVGHCQGAAGRNLCEFTRFAATCSEEDEAKVKVDYDVVLRNPENGTVGPSCDYNCVGNNLREAMGQLFAITADVGGLVAAGDERLEPAVGDAASLHLDTASYKYGAPVIMCQEEGHVLTKNRLCVPCDAGYYLPADEYETCLPCPKGTYQPHTGQISCRNCYDDSTTEDAGSTHPTQCTVRISRA